MDNKINDKLLKPYDPKETEGRIYKLWEDSGFFNPDNLPDERKEKYCIIMPPPNANGRLHAGHGVDMTLKDVLIRYHRMLGKKTLFLPGSDHAGFETQGVFEKKLQKEGRSRFGMDRDELYKEIYSFVMEHKHTTEDDLRRLGVSCDWSRNIFTLDPSVVSRTQDTFIKMHKEGLIYRGERIIHWNPKFQTSLSDIETKFENRREPLYYLKYGPFTIATSRPETKFGDKYVVMHPDDKRYTKYKDGEKLTLEWINGHTTATVVKDEAIDMEFGTGVMTITPWHDMTDFEISKRHNLEYEQIIDFDGRLMDIAGEFAGEKINVARQKIVDKFKGKGLLVKTDEKYEHTVRICERTGAVIEPQIMKQWFVKMDSLSKNTLTSLDAKEYRFITNRFEKIFRHWMENPIDWNISRQIVWGIQIPAWFKNKETDEEEIIVSKNKPDGDGWEKDNDTFDTWFSSGQWPLMTLGYPDGKDMEYYPTNVMETGSDLVFKWVPRMIMFGLYLVNKVPFKDIYFHGMVLDSKGQKMSKSKGNTLSPILLGDKYGMDATRMAFVVANPPGSDMSLSEDKVRAYKHFANKIWNISRFVLSNIDSDEISQKPKITTQDQEYIDELEKLTKDITQDIENYRLYLAAEKIYHYVWHRFADEIIEESKNRLMENDTANKLSISWTLLEMLKTIIKITHPFMPFITEEIWTLIPTQKDKKMLMIESWPIVK